VIVPNFISILSFIAYTREILFYIKYKNLLQQKILYVVANKIKLKQIKESASVFRLVRWNIMVRSNKNLGCVGVEKANHLEQCKV
jgi:hypothetical protein